MKSDDVDSVINRLLEQELGEPEELDKPFPHKSFATGQRLSQHGTSMHSRGKPWLIKVHATQHPFPQELFKELTLHGATPGVEGESGYLGWIGGTITVGGRYDRTKMIPFVDQETTPTQDGKDPEPGEKVPLRTLGSCFVEELQSDVIQRTVYFTSKEQRRRSFQRRIATTSSEYGPLFTAYEKAQKELQRLSQPASAPISGELLKQRLAAEERLEELLAELQRLGKDIDQEKTLYPQFAGIRSKVENAFKKWVEAFFNAALRLAQRNNCTFFGILSAAEVRSLLSGRESALFDRVYDGVAKRWGMEPRKLSGKTYWLGRVSEMQPLESVTRIVNDLLGEEIEPPEFWPNHLETFFRVFMRYEGIDLADMEIGNYARDEAVGHVFAMWLDEVQDELKNDPDFREAVNTLVAEKYGTDVSSRWGVAQDDDDDDDWSIDDTEIDQLFHGDLPDGGISDEEIDRLFSGESRES